MLADIYDALDKFEENAYYFECGREYERLLIGDAIEYYVDQYLFTLPEIGYAFQEGYIAVDNGEEPTDVIVVYRTNNVGLREVADIYANVSLSSVMGMIVQENHQDPEKIKCVLSINNNRNAIS